jgi:hypothetical protein
MRLALLVSGASREHYDAVAHALAATSDMPGACRRTSAAHSRRWSHELRSPDSRFAPDETRTLATAPGFERPHPAQLQWQVDSAFRLPRLQRLLWRDAEILSRVNFVRMRQHRFVRLEDFLVRIGVTVKLLGNLG